MVNISVISQRTTATNPLFHDPFFRRFFNVPEQAPSQSIPRQSAGSGVIIDAELGHVVTNHHVDEGAEEITITLQDGRRFEAELVGSDPDTDIALLRIDAVDLTEIPVGDSDALEVGDFVAAIGNPFGIGQTVTSGIVSALGRSGLNLEGYEDFIQTDAPINPGNSGGALIDLDGNLVGINTAIIAPAGGNVGIGFAVPTAMIKSVVDQILEYGEVRRGRLGVLIQDITPDLADALDLESSRGVIVTQVEESSPAEAAGLKAGDVIISVNGAIVEGASDLRNRIGLVRIGDTVNIAFLRDGRSMKVSAKIGEVAANQVSAKDLTPRLSGAIFRDIEPGHPLHQRVKGVEVAGVEPGSPAWRSGLRAGDLILSVNRTGVASMEEFVDAIRSTQGTIALNIQRDARRLFLIIQ